MARERGVTYVKLDGDVGILGNGAGLVMSTLDVVAQAGRQARQLPRRRRRRPGRRDRDGARGHPLRPEGARDPVQHLRRHHALRRGRAGHPRRRSTSSTSSVPIVVRLDGTNDVEGRKLLADAAPPNVYVERDDARTRPERVVELAGARPDGDPGDRARRGSSCRASPAARARSTRCATATTARNVVAGVTPGKGGQDVEGIPVFDTVARRRRETRARTRRWCSCRRGSPPTRSTRRPTPASRRSSASPRASRRTTCSTSTTTCARAA